jgi:hypothetical protein
MAGRGLEMHDLMLFCGKNLVAYILVQFITDGDLAGYKISFMTKRQTNNSKPSFLNRTNAVSSLPFFSRGSTSPSGSGPPHYRSFTITLRHTTLGRTPLDEWSARRTDLYQTTHNTQHRQTSMPSAGFEPATPASERAQTHDLDRAATESCHLR